MKDLSTKQLLKQVQREMLAIKTSWMPQLLYSCLQCMFVPGLSPSPSVYSGFCDIPHGIFTNVPGPTIPISFAGEQIQEYRTFPPQSGKGSIGIALISYCGQVSIGAIADVHQNYPHLAEGICHRFCQEFDIILEEAKMEISKKSTF
jgi:diacylglycerol O-acyltransferase